MPKLIFHRRINIFQHENNTGTKKAVSLPIVNEPHSIYTMDNNIKKILETDTNGLLTYEYIANNMGNIDEDMSTLVDNMILKDRTGQFVVSTARYLNAIDREKYAESIDLLVKAAIARDRDHVYLAYLASSLWGSDYKEHAAELSAKDDNFRRIYKRLYPVGI